MYAPDNVFPSESILLLKPVTNLAWIIEQHHVEGGKLWLYITEDVTEEVILPVMENLASLFERSDITSFW